MQELYMRSFDNTVLYVRKDYVSNPKGIIVIVHGVSESSNRYHHVISAFNEMGYSTIAFDNRGNGRSNGPVGDCNSFMDFIEDTHQMVELAKNDHDKVYLLGHSMGGFIVNAYVCKYQDISGVISSGAVGIYLDQVKPFKYIPFKLFKKLWIKNNLAGALSHNPRVSEAYLLDPYVNKRNRVNLFGECFVKGVKYLQKNYHNYHGPILYLHGADDSIVPATSTNYLFHLTESLDKEIHLYEKFYHEIFNEIGQEYVFEDIRRWLEKHE